MATWSTAYMNDLPDSAFLYIEPGGSKDADGKTTPRSLRHFPYKDASGAVDLPHLRNALSRIPQSNLPSEVKSRVTAKAQRILQENTASATTASDLLRYLAAAPGLFELREADEGERTLVGHFARFNEWAQINSSFEGNFFERLSPSSLDKTIAENRSNMRVLFQHGKDPQIGEKILGPIAELRADAEGAYYEVPLFDTSYNRDLIPGLEAGLYGASFRFRVLQENFERRPEPSEHNPEGLPERTITEAKVMEFGPVTFPAYEGATAGLRSATDWWLEQDLLRRIESLKPRAAALEAEPAEEPATPSKPSRSTHEVPDYLGQKEEGWTYLPR